MTLKNGQAISFSRGNVSYIFCVSDSRFCYDYVEISSPMVTIKSMGDLVNVFGDYVPVKVVCRRGDKTKTYYFNLEDLFYISEEEEVAG